MSTIYVLRTFGSVLLLGVTPPVVTLPSNVLLSVRGGMVTAEVRSGTIAGKVRDGTANLQVRGD